MVDNAFWLRFIPGLCTEYTGLYPFYPLYVINAFSLNINGLMMVFVHKKLTDVDNALTPPPDEVINGG